MIIGITGISGSGKHTVADFLGQKGWVILDADKIAHYLYRPYTGVWKAINKRFGDSILTAKDKIDRNKLGDIVFNSDDKEALNDLNNITHPEIKRHIKNEIHYLRRKKKDIVVVGALWEEIGMTEYCERILLLKVNNKIAFDRIQKRDGITQEVFNMRIKNQVAPQNPDFTITNEGEFKELYETINKLPINIITT